MTKCEPCQRAVFRFGTWPYSQIPLRDLRNSGTNAPESNAVEIVEMSPNPLDTQSQAVFRLLMANESYFRAGVSYERSFEAIPAATARQLARSFVRILRI